MRKLICDRCNTEIKNRTEANLVSLPSGKLIDACDVCRKSAEEHMRKWQETFA